MAEVQINTWHINRAQEILKQKLIVGENWTLEKYNAFVDEYLTLTDITDYSEWRIRLHNALVVSQVPRDPKKFVLEIANKVSKLQDKLNKEEERKKEREQEQLARREDKETDIINASTYEHEGILYEQCTQECYVWHNPTTNQTGLTDYIEIKQPIYDNHNAMTPYTIKKVYPNQGEELKREVVLLAQKPQDYGTVPELIEEIKTYIHEWCDLPEQYQTFAAWYVLLTWVYDQMPAINYLRIMGDAGTGKSRFLETVGRICYKATIGSGGVTVAAVKRLTDKWRGTLVIDEGDFPEGDESNELVKFFNLGFEKNKAMFNCDKNDPSQIEFFDPYCPKIIATRRQFKDQALESRCLTHVSRQTNRKNISILPTKAYYEKQKELRNKLLKFRFDHYSKIDMTEGLKVDLGNIEPRLKQATMAFTIFFHNTPEYIETFKAFLFEYNKELIEERATSYDGEIVNAIIDLMLEAKPIIRSQDIVDLIKSDKVTTRSVGKHLKQMGIKTVLKKVEGKVNRQIVVGDNFMDLCKRYCDDPEKIGNVVTLVTSYRETPPLSLPNSLSSFLNENDNKNDAVSVVNVTNVTTCYPDSQNNILFDEKYAVWLPCEICKDTPCCQWKDGKNYCKTHFTTYSLEHI